MKKWFAPLITLVLCFSLLLGSTHYSMSNVDKANEDNKIMDNVEQPIKFPKDFPSSIETVKADDLQIKLAINNIMKEAKRDPSSKYLVEHEHIDGKFSTFGYVVCPRCSANILMSQYQDSKITGEARCHLSAKDQVTGLPLHDEVVTYYTVTEWSCPNKRCDFNNVERLATDTVRLCFHTVGL